MTAVSVKKVAYGGWQNVYRIANATVDLHITQDVGPRIIRYGFVGKENEFCEVADNMGKTGGDEWRLFGGHRLWHAPEHPQRTYYPDNSPITIEAHENGVTASMREPTTGIGKTIEIRLAEEGSYVHLVHRLKNHGLWTVELAPWALSVMTVGGVGIAPHVPKGEHPRDLLPATGVIVWPYTQMGDPRWTWGNRYILLRQDPKSNAPQKFGMSSAQGWAAYARGGHLFVKTFRHFPDRRYPDMGAVMEMFTNHFMLEVETLGPLTTLEPSAEVVHEEVWYLYDGVPLPTNDAEVDQHVMPKVRDALAHWSA